jgi:hypothetical protein
VPGDFGEGLTALRDSAEEENPSMTGRGPAFTRMSNRIRGERTRRAHVC